jgi:hypothetical protein
MDARDSWPAIWLHTTSLVDYGHPPPGGPDEENFAPDLTAELSPGSNAAGQAISGPFVGMANVIRCDLVPPLPKFGYNALSWHEIGLRKFDALSLRSCW